MDEGRVGLVPDAAEVGGRGDLGPDRGRVEELVLVAVLPQELGGLLEPARPRAARARRRGRRSARGRSRSRGARCRRRSPRSSRGRAARAAAISSAKRALPFSIPCVSEPRAKPPLRPLAPKPTVSASSTTTSRDGIVGLRVERRPEPGEAAADDAEVGLGRAVERRLRLARRQRVQPVRAHCRVRERRALGLGRRGVGPRERHGRESTDGSRPPPSGPRTSSRMSSTGAMTSGTTGWSRRRPFRSPSGSGPAPSGRARR